MIKLYKLIIAYDGTDFLGWQEQDNLPTICNELKRSFRSVFKDEISIVGASRTDGGVHAEGQVARIRTKLDIDPEKLKIVWNRRINEAIVIKDIERCDESFHPQKNVLEKKYIYKIFTQKPFPTIQRFGLYYDYPIDIKKLRDALNVFVGTHDFRSFCTGHDMKSTIRKINKIDIEEFQEPNGAGEITGIKIIFYGESFLRYMIRRIVGACVEVSSKKNTTIDILIKALAQKSPQQSLENAPAKGLTLDSIKYRN